MIAIIPCAGRGTRRRPETNYKPKILLEYPNPPNPPCQGGMKGEPLIEHIARPIDESGLFDKIVFVLSPRTGNQIIDYVRRNPFDTPHTYVWQHEPLGFGHAVLQARDEVFSFRRWNPPVLVHTDDAVNLHLREGASLIKQITSKETSTLGVQWREDVREHGMVVVGESEGASHVPRANSPVTLEVKRLVEKPYWDEGGLCMTGIYFIRESRRLFRCLSRLVKSGRKLGGEYQFTHALQIMIDQGTPFQTYYHEWIDCGKDFNARAQRGKDAKEKIS